jgi:hypothetical protein
MVLLYLFCELIYDYISKSNFRASKVGWLMSDESEIIRKEAFVL